MVDKKLVYRQLDKVVDPEINVPITEMNLIDEVEVKNGSVSIEFHFTTPMCPPGFAMKIGEDIKRFVGEIKGVKSVHVKVKGHIFSDQINEELKNAKV